MQLPGGRASWMKFWLTCLLAWFTGACTDLPQLERGSCGNRIVEPELGEFCDGSDGCGQPDGDYGCQWHCDEQSCPAGYSCGSDNVCRQPTHSFDAAYYEETELSLGYGLSYLTSEPCPVLARVMNSGLRFSAGLVGDYPDENFESPCSMWDGEVSGEYVPPLPPMAFGDVTSITADGPSEMFVTFGVGSDVSQSQLSATSQTYGLTALHMTDGGTFAPLLSPSIALEYEAVALAKVNYDAYDSRAAIVVFGSSGDGSESEVVFVYDVQGYSETMGTVPIAAADIATVVAADFDGDSCQDLAVVGADASTIHVLFVLEFFEINQYVGFCDTRWVDGSPEAERVEVTLADGATVRGRNTNLLAYQAAIDPQVNGDCGDGAACCSENLGSVGCADSTVEACVCAQDDYCCENEWDQLCARQVELFGCGSCGSQLLVADQQGRVHLAYSAGSSCCSDSPWIGTPFCSEDRGFGSAVGTLDATTTIIDFDTVVAEDGPEPLPDPHEPSQVLDTDVFTVVGGDGAASDQSVFRVSCALPDVTTENESGCPATQECRIIKSDFNTDGFDDLVYTTGNEARITYVDGASSASAYISTSCPVTDLEALDINGDSQQDVAYIDRNFGGVDEPKSVLKIVYGTGQGPSSTPETLGYFDSGSLVGGAFNYVNGLNQSLQTLGAGPQDLFVTVDDPSGETEAKVRGALFRGSLWSAPTAPIFFALEYEQEEEDKSFLELASPRAFSYGRFAAHDDQVLSGLAVLTGDPLWSPENEGDQQPWLLWRLQKREGVNGLAAFLEDASGDAPLPILEGASLPVTIDVNNDGIDEVALFAGNAITIYRAADTGFEAMPDAVGATSLEYFYWGEYSDYPFQYASKPQVVDLDGDSNLDIMIRPDSTSALVVYFGDGQGGFDEHVVAPEDLDGGAFPYFGFAAINLDADPRLEIISYGSGHWRVFGLSDEPQRYEENASLAELAFGSVEEYWMLGVQDATEVFVADLDADGIQDVVVAGWAGFVALRGGSFAAHDAGGAP